MKTVCFLSVVALFISILVVSLEARSRHSYASLNNNKEANSVSSLPEQLNFSTWDSALFVVAHPDDIEGCAGGTVWALTQAGVEVYYVITTNGDKGCGSTICQNWTAEEIAYVRMQEQYAAAAVLNVPRKNVFFMDYEDSMLTSYPEVEVRQQLVYWIRRLRPSAVFTWNPFPNFKLRPSEGWYDLGYHPDHMQTGHLTLDANFDAGVGPLFSPYAGEALDYSPYFYMFEFLEPTNYVNLTEIMLQKKIQAFEAHTTQYPSTEEVEAYIDGVVSATAHNTFGNASVYIAPNIEAFIAYW